MNRLYFGRAGSFLFCFIAASFVDLASGQATGPALDPPAAEEDDAFFDEYALPAVSDPFEPFNRTMFKFNETVMKTVVRPVARGYEKVIPKNVRRGLGNFFYNLRFPIRFISSLFQGKIDRSGAEIGKFIINSTVGLAGFIKVSDSIPELRVPDEDVGQTFGAWGIGHGPFLIIPVLGPSSVRDLVGRAGDYALTPYHWRFMDEYNWEWRTGLEVTDTLNTLPELVRVHDALRQSAVDPYIAFRNAYIQSRDAAVKQ